MEDWLGQQFLLNDVEYIIVDVRKLNGEYMVFAEAEQAALPRATFRAADVADHLLMRQV